MSELIVLSEFFPITELNSIDARKLHKALEVKSKFYDWITPKLDDFKIDED